MRGGMSLRRHFHPSGPSLHLQMQPVRGRKGPTVRRSLPQGRPARGGGEGMKGFYDKILVDYVLIFNP